MTRFVVCGETLIDLIRSADGPQDAAGSTWSALSAGGPMNSAVALGRLGVPTHFLGRLSTDTFGQQLRSYIEAAGVELDLAAESGKPPRWRSSASMSRGSRATPFTLPRRPTSAGSPTSCPLSPLTIGFTSPRCPAS